MMCVSGRYLLSRSRELPRHAAALSSCRDSLTMIAVSLESLVQAFRDFDLFGLLALPFRGGDASDRMRSASAAVAGL